ncbi:MAG: enoyl-CoA hydratase/isomerase family protein, partial [Bdellovibrionales bacterium]|nr:enoyl-CoA hydratase/isomerase family protein [Bdellovibrionales bacterium]
MSDNSVLRTQDSHVAILTLNRPDVLNSFNQNMARALQAQLSECQNDKRVRSILLNANGRGFCAGQDLSEVCKDGQPAKIDLGEIVRECYNPIISALMTLEKPVVCAVPGVAAGAGANLAFA